MEIAKVRGRVAGRIAIYGRFVTLIGLFGSSWKFWRRTMAVPTEKDRQSTGKMPVPPTAALAGLEPQIDALREVGGILWQRGWSVGTSSNYSVVISRDPLELLITASGKDKGR